MDRAGNSHSKWGSWDPEKQAASLYIILFVDVSFKSSAVCVPAEGVPMGVQLEVVFYVFMILE